jgi:MATE family multidrug resistance protein
LLPNALNCLLNYKVLPNKNLFFVPGVARGSGWQQIGAYVNLGAYYLIGIPVAALLGFLLRLRGKGLWIGILTRSIMQAILLAFITAFTNWQIQVFILAFHLRICFSSPSDLVTKKVKN